MNTNPGSHRDPVASRVGSGMPGPPREATITQEAGTNPVRQEATNLAINVDENLKVP